MQSVVRRSPELRFVLAALAVAAVPVGALLAWSPVHTAIHELGHALVWPFDLQARFVGSNGFRGSGPQLLIGGGGYAAQLAVALVCLHIGTRRRWWPLVGLGVGQIGWIAWEWPQSADAYQLGPAGVFLWSLIYVAAVVWVVRRLICQVRK